MEMPKEVTLKVGDTIVCEQGTECLVVWTSKYLLGYMNADKIAQPLYTQDELEQQGWKLKPELTDKELESWLENKDAVPFYRMPKQAQEALKELGTKGVEIIDFHSKIWIDCDIPISDWHCSAYRRRRRFNTITKEQAEELLTEYFGEPTKITY